MTAEEKAKDIFVRMMEYTPDSIVQDNYKAKHLAKLHALIMIDGIIEAVEAFGYSGTFYDHEQTRKMTCSDDVDPGTFWREVKLEIDKQ